MKKVIVNAFGVSAWTAGLIFGLVLPASAQYGQRVEGYYRSNGTYVQPHYRSSPNDTQRDNYSTYGNRNPYTGEQGTKKCGLYDNC